MQIILPAFISLDGVVQAPGGPEEDTDGGFAHGGWSMPYFDPEVMGGAFDDVMQRTEAMLFGRRTWQVAASAWPERGGDPFSDRINTITKYVASRTLSVDDLTWSGSTLLPADDAIGAIRELRARDGGGLQILGSASLAEQLVAERPGRRVRADDRADPARRRQAHLPGRRLGTPARARLQPDGEHRGDGVHLPARALVSADVTRGGGPSSWGTCSNASHASATSS